MPSQIGNFALSHYANPAVAFTEATGTPQESGLKRRNFNHPERANPRQIIVQVSTLDRQIGTWQRLDYLKIDRRKRMGERQGGAKARGIKLGTPDPTVRRMQLG
jgi:hypothetical protein